MRNNYILGLNYGEYNSSACLIKNGNIKVALRLFNKSYLITKHTRLTQICLPSLNPFFIKLVEPEDLSNTIRGQGGFGSTGR